MNLFKASGIVKAGMFILAASVMIPAISAQTTAFAWVDAQTDDKDKILPGVNPAKVTGSIITAGSSTVFPLSEAIAERFRKDGYKGQIIIDSIGTGGGFERFAKSGDTDIANASRAIKPSETAWAAALKPARKPVEFRIGTDALAVCVSEKNTFASDVSVAELGKIFSTAKLWSDVRASWPKKEIRRFSPGTDSGTFDYFVEHVYNKNRTPLLSAANLQLSEDDNVLVQGIAGDEYAIGYFGFAYVTENKSSIKPLSIAGVVPGKASVDAGTYPLSRPLFLYSDADIITGKPQIAAFLSYYLSNVNLLIAKVGYFPAPLEAMKESKQRLAKIIAGKY
jgi:phosphate transport system substrate-binding protein